MLRTMWPLLVSALLLVSCGGSAATSTTMARTNTPAPTTSAATSRTGGAATVAVGASLSVTTAMAAPATTRAGASPTATCAPTRGQSAATPPIAVPPARASVGEGHVLTGVARSARDCAPLANARIVFWLAGPNGRYDPDHEATVFTDATGAYRFTSNYPGQYEGAGPHIHIYVSADGHQGLETVYQPSSGQTEGRFDLVLSPAAP